MEEKKKEEKTLIVSSDYYSSSYIVNKVYLVTIKRYTIEHSLMIVDTTRADEHITITLLSAIYRNLSRPDTDSLMITSYSQKLNRMNLVEIDTYNLLEKNQLHIKIPNIDESKEKKKKENLHPDQSWRNPVITDDSKLYPETCKPVFKERALAYCIHKKNGECKIDTSNPDHYCPAGDDIDFNCSDFSELKEKDDSNEVSTSTNTEGR